MSASLFERFAGWAVKNGWKIETSGERTNFPPDIVKRYDIPAEWADFASSFTLCEDSSACKCFLSAGDYVSKPPEVFSWNEFELQETAFAEDDEEEKARVRAFWDRYMPVFLSVSGEYAYYAIDTRSGAVISGCEPEYEEFSTEAEDLRGFIERIISGDIVL